jgi:hypothetical protein
VPPERACGARAADDRVDPASRAALASFERAAGPTVEGMIAIEFLIVLGKAFGGGPSPGGREH